MLPYLLDRFRSDAETLRLRAAALRDGPPQPGPDAATSQRMAEACDEVLTMLTTVPDRAAGPEIASALTALIPELERRAAAASAPPVRAVFAGAATRIREVVEIERRHQDDDDEDGTR